MKPSKKKEKILIYQMAVFFLIIFVFFGILIIQQKGNPFQFMVAKNKILAYAKEHYENFEQRFSLGEITYHPQDKSYNTIVSYQENPNLTFIISFNRDKSITDTYDYDYVKGGNYLLRLENELTTLWKKEMKDDSFLKQYNHLSIKFNQTLNEMDEKTKEEVLSGTPDLTKKIYDLEASITLDQMNVNEFAKIFKNLHQKSETTSFVPNSYQIMFYDKKNPKSGIEISGVSQELLEEDQVLIAITELMIDEDKANETYGISCKIVN